MDYCLIAFSSTHAAICAQKQLEKDWNVQVMPVLREVSSGCGIALRIPPEHWESVRSALLCSGLAKNEYTLYGVEGTGRAMKVRPL